MTPGNAERVRPIESVAARRHQVAQVVQARRASGHEPGGTQCALGVGATAEGAVADSHLLTIAGEDNLMLARIAAGPDGVETNLAGLTWRVPPLY